MSAPSKTERPDQRVQPTLVEALQRRIVRLLLRHDRTLFHGQFVAHYRTTGLPDLPILHAYDRLICLLALADELLTDLLPRIYRQISLHTSSRQRTEEPPLTGTIDWHRSLQHSWQAFPDQPPTRFATTQRQQSIITPANRLLAAVLQYYVEQLTALRHRPALTDDPLTEDEQHELQTIEAQIRRALAAPPLVDLADEVESHQLIDLAEQLKPTLPPDSSYRALIDWWHRLLQLQLTSATPPGTARPLLDTPLHTEQLYQLWLLLELLELLHIRGALNEITLTANQYAGHFTWQGRTFQLLLNAAVHPPFLQIERSYPLKVQHQQQTIWREPAVLLITVATATTSQQALAQLHQHDTPHGFLIVPSAPAHNSPPPKERYRNIIPAPTLETVQLQPLAPLDTLHTHLCTLLAQATTWLPERPPITCLGMLQDEDTVNPNGTLPRRCASCGSLLALCPKPHISPERVDLVCPQCDCLHHQQLCHILGSQPTSAYLPPFIKRVLNREQLFQRIEQLRSRLGILADSLDDPCAPEDLAIDETDDETIEQARTMVLQTIGELTESYLRLKQPDTAQIEDKLLWVFGAVWHAGEHPRALAPTARDMLISGEYVWNEFQQLDVRDWAACAVQYVRAVEHELRRRLYNRCGRPSTLRYYDEPMEPYQFTFGSVSRAYRKRQLAEPDPNWQTLLTYAAEASGSSRADFEDMIRAVTRLRRNRNKIAHSQRIDRAIAGTVRSAVLGHPNQVGVLRRLAELLDPFDP